MKKSPRQRIVKRLDGLLREVIRLRDEDTCQKCGKKVYGSNSQPSHVIPKSQSLLLRWNLWNVKLLCNACHRWWHLNPLDSAFWFRQTWPVRNLLLQEHKHNIGRSWKMSDFEKVEAELKQKLEDLKGKRL